MRNPSCVKSRTRPTLKVESAHRCTVPSDVASHVNLGFFCGCNLPCEPAFHCTAWATGTSRSPVQCSCRVSSSRRGAGLGAGSESSLAVLRHTESYRVIRSHTESRRLGSVNWCSPSCHQAVSRCQGSCQGVRARRSPHPMRPHYGPGDGGGDGCC